MRDIEITQKARDRAKTRHIGWRQRQDRHNYERAWRHLKTRRVLSPSLIHLYNIINSLFGYRLIFKRWSANLNLDTKSINEQGLS